MRRFGIAVALALLSPVTLPGLATQPAFNITIESGSPYYQPAAAKVVTGTPIQWTNPTASYHTITHDGCVAGGPCLFDSGSVPPDGSYTLPGLPPGLYPYHCRLHPIMRGVLTVVEVSTSAEKT
ncbi:cupredoxin domain-containing protein [Nitrospira sp. Kam-Ns4a]